jgi:hypothetical protein
MFPQLGAKIWTLQNIVNVNSFSVLLEQKTISEFASPDSLTTIIQQIKAHHSAIDWAFIVCVSVAFVISINRRYNGNCAKILAVRDVSKIEKTVEIVLFIFMMVFTKNIENAI